MKKESLYKVIECCALIVIGVLFCVSLAWAENVLSIILGSALIAGGVVIQTLSVIKDKSVVSPIALGGLLALALGIYFIVVNAVGIIFTFVPYILIVFGSALFIDAFIGYFARKEKVVAALVIKLVIGAALITVGILLLTVGDFAKYVALIVGIALILVGITNIVLEFAKAEKSN